MPYFRQTETTLDQPELPADPFVIKQAEWAVWNALVESGALEEILARQNDERATKERDIMRRRLAQTYDNVPRSLFCCETLYYFLGRISADIVSVHAALVTWRTCLTRRDVYMTGRCHEFALVAHAHLGWPIRLALCPKNGWPPCAGRVIHVALEAPDGRLFDVEGYKTGDRAETIITSEPWRTISIDQLVALTDTEAGGLSPFGDLSAARTALALVLGIDPDAVAGSENILPHRLLAHCP